MNITTKFRSWLLCLVACAALAACSDDDSDNEVTLPGNGNEEPATGTRADETWVIYNSNTGWAGGVYAVTGDKTQEINLTGKPFFQVASSLGGRVVGSDLYKVNDPTNSRQGINRMTINAQGRVEDGGFLDARTTAYETNYLVVSATEGYYWSLPAGGMKVQTFNPSTMERTGEIDFSALSEGHTETYQAAGQLILAKRDNKLLVDVQFGTKNPADWQIAPATQEVHIGVYDLATKQVSLTTMPGTTHLGVFIDHVLYSVDSATNDFYVVAVGNMKTQPATAASKILRIKSGQTTFDPDFSIDITDYQFPAEFNRLFVHNNKIYTTIPSRAVSYYNGGQHGVKYRDDVWYWNEIDVATGRATRLNIPPDNFYNTQNPFLFEGEIYFTSNNAADKFNGVTQYNPRTGITKETFHLKESGRMMGFAIIKK
jgi:hypothetical protein